MQENNKLGLGRIAIAKEYMPDKESYRLLFWICIALGSILFSLLSIHYPEGTLLFFNSSPFYLIPVGFAIFWFVPKLLYFSINLLRYKKILLKKKEVAKGLCENIQERLKNLEDIKRAASRIENDLPNAPDLILGIKRKFESRSLLGPLNMIPNKADKKEVLDLYEKAGEFLRALDRSDIIFERAVNEEHELDPEETLQKRYLAAACAISEFVQKTARKLSVIKRHNAALIEEIDSIL